MIDEKLYQLATDELNSDKRKPEIWARACALASNDHDEARYLYTNLRVEELVLAPQDRPKGKGKLDLHRTFFAKIIWKARPNAQGMNLLRLDTLAAITDARFIVARHPE